MKITKKDRSHSRSYGPSVVYYDTLVELLLIVNAEQTELTNEQYRFEGLEELREHYGSGAIHDLKIDFSRPAAVVTFSRMDTRMFVLASPTSTQLFHDLNERLEGCERRPRFLYGSWLFILPMAISAVSYFYEPQISGFPVMFPVMGVVALWIVWAFFVKLRRHSTIYLRRKHEATTFLQRNRDAIGMNILSAIGGSALTLIATYLKAKWAP